MGLFLLATALSLTVQLLQNKSDREVKHETHYYAVADS